MTLSWEDRKEVEAIVDRKIEELRNKTTELLADQQPEHGPSCADYALDRLEHAKKLDELDKKWSDGAARVGNLIIASENYKDPDTGNDTFTWKEAMALEKDGKLPDGWRLPTAQELAKIYAEFGFDKNGKDSSEHFMAETHSEHGYWWSSTSTSKNYARVLHFYSITLWLGDNDKGILNGVRCVKEFRDEI